MRMLALIAGVCFTACSAEMAPPPDPIPRSETADIDGDGFLDSVALTMNENGWQLALTFGGRPHDRRTIDSGEVAAQAPRALSIKHGGAYEPAPSRGEQPPKIQASEDVIIYERHDRRRMLVWNSPDTGIERIAIR